MSSLLKSITEEAAKAVVEAAEWKAKAEAAEAAAEAAEAKAEAAEARAEDAEAQERTWRAKVRRVKEEKKEMAEAWARAEGGETAVEKLARQAALREKARERIYANQTLTREEYEAMPESDRDSCWHDRYRGAVAPRDRSC